MHLKSFILPLLFIGVLALLGVGIWLFQTFGGSDSGTTNGQSDFFGSLFPFGSGDAPVDTETTPGGESDTGLGPVPAVRHITDQEVAGATFARSNNTLVVRYVERETGHIYEVPVDSYTKTRLTNTTIPAVHDAVWVTASTTILRFMAEDGSIENFYSSFGSSTPDQSLDGIFLRPYARFALGSGGASLVGVLDSSVGSTIEVSLPDGTKPKSLIVSPLSSWVPLGVGNSVYLASAPTAGTFGALYDVTSGTLRRVVGDIPGLEALPNTAGTHMLISGGGRRVMVLSALDLKTGVRTAIPLASTVSKCAWVGLTNTALCAIPQDLPLANYPDDWLLGRVHTADNLWFIDTGTGVTTAATDLIAEGVQADVAKIRVSDDGGYALFSDRMDGTLWLAELNPTQ